MKVFKNIFLLILTIGLAIACLAKMDDAPLSFLKATERFEIGDNTFSGQALSANRIQIRHSDGSLLDISGSGERWNATQPWKDRVDYHTHVNPLIHFIHHSKIIDVIPRKELQLSDIGMREGFYEIELFNKESESIEKFTLGRSTPWHSILESEDKPIFLPTYFLRHQSSSKKDYIYLVSDSSGLAPSLNNAEPRTELNNLSEIFKDRFKNFRDHRPFSIYSSISQIRILRNGTDMLLERTATGNPWYLTKPLELRCDQDAIKDLIADLSKLSADQLTSSDSFTETLDPDQAMEIGIRHFEEEEETTLSIALPSEELATTAKAIVSNRNTVFHLPLNPRTSIDVSVSKLPNSINDLRSKTMLSLNGKELKTIVIRPSNQPPTLLNRERGKLYELIQADGPTRAGVDTLAEFIQALTVDKVVRFASDAAVDLSQYGLDNPLIQVALLDYANNQKRLLISRNPKDSLIYATVAQSSIVWQVSEETLLKIDRPNWEWKPKDLWVLPAIDIASITTKRKQGPEISVEYDFDSDSYTASIDGKDSTDQLNSNRASYFFESIAHLRSIRRLGPYNQKAKNLLEDPDFTLRVTVQKYDDNGDPSYDIDHWLKLARVAKAANNKLFYVSTSDTSDCFLIDIETANILATDLFE